MLPPFGPVSQDDVVLDAIVNARYDDDVGDLGKPPRDSSAGPAGAGSAGGVLTPGIRDLMRSGTGSGTTTPRGRRRPSAMSFGLVMESGSDQGPSGTTASNACFSALSMGG
jgi:hypothetical protein